MFKHEINNTEIQVINHETLDIFVGPFTNSEYNRVKNNIIYGKATGPYGIPIEVFKYTYLDDIVLEYANKMLIQS